MQIGMVGLGAMGGNMARRLHDGGHKVVGFDIDAQKVSDVCANLSASAQDLRTLTASLSKPRVIWLSVPHGDITEKVIHDLSQYLSPGDILIDGGNSKYKDSMRRAKELLEKNIHLLDIGVGGGIWGLADGYCLMVGGEKDIFSQIEPILKTLSAKNGYAYLGESGAGHYAGMVQTGIEYAMMEGYGEGFEILAASPFNLDPSQMASLWMHGSMIRSFLLALSARIFSNDPNLSGIRGCMEDSGEGRMLISEAIEKEIPIPSIAEALFARYRSADGNSFSAKVIAAIRHESGGYKLAEVEETEENSDQAA